jgi:Holliday junction DNA helicase RuvB
MENEDRALRPESFDTFLGQEEAKHNLRVFVASAKARGEVLCHLLFQSQPGLGKTSLAHVVANEMGSRLIVVNGPALKSKGELAGILLNLKKGDILFIDEIHSLHPKVEEILYPAMEDGKLEIVSGEGVTASALTLELAPFTLIGATTRAGMLQRPLRDRFGEIIQMVPYSDEELSQIVLKNAGKLNLMIDHSAAMEIARRSRGTPRIANRLIRRVRDFATYENVYVVNQALVCRVCNNLGIDSIGLDKISREYLNVLSNRGAVALNTLVSLLGESKDTIEEVIEPNLLRFGLIDKTPKGRVITPDGSQHIHPANERMLRAV